MLINKLGYSIPLNELTDADLKDLKQTLTVKPLVLEAYDYGQVKSFSMFRLSEKKIYIPKFFGIEKYGQAKKYYKNEGMSMNCEFNGALLPHQVEYCGTLLNEILTNDSCIAHGQTGSGKCHGINTPIMMYDGNVKMVQDIIIGDKIMGDDSEPRNIISLGQGEDIMYELIPTNGDKYIFNSEHILCLKITNIGVCFTEKNTETPWVAKYLDKIKLKIDQKTFKSEQMAREFLENFTEEDKILEIPINKYLKLSHGIKHVLKWFRTSVNFPARDVPFDPYIIGFWIGDGHSNGTGITTQDSTIIKYIKENLQKYNLFLSYISEYEYNIRGINWKKGSNIFKKVLDDLNLIGNKHIPDIYKINSRKVRLELLAGLIDSDGHLQGNCYEFTQKNEKTMDGVIYLARSLGFSAYKKTKKTSWTYKNEKKFGNTFRITISGHTDEIPCKIPRKQALMRQQKKNVLVTGFKLIERPSDRYYGFTIDGNNRYLLGDFSVTHNTVMTLWLASRLKARTLILVHKEFLANQWSDRIKQYLPGATIGFIQQDKCELDNDFVIGMIQTIISRDLQPKLFDNIKFSVIDECFTRDQLIVTDKGAVPIGTLYNIYNGILNVNLPDNLKVLPKVLSYNELNNTLEYKNITYAWERKNENILNISYGRGKIKCTVNHKILTCSGYIEANKLKIGDLIRCNYVLGEQNSVAQDLNSDQYQILLGSFLGDGNVQILPMGRHRLKILHCEKQREYCEWKANMFNCVLNKVENNGYTKGIAYSFTTKIIDSEKQFPIKKTTCPQWILDELDFRGLAIWWMDDGHLNKKTGGTLSTCSFDEDSHTRIISKLKNMGITDVEYRKDGHGYFSIYFRKKGMYELLTNIRKYLHPSMKYKFYNKHLIDAIIFKYIIPKETYESYVWNKNFSNFGTIKIKSIDHVKNSDARSRVYDLEVEDNHNFILSSGTENVCGPIVHNCHHIAAASFSQTLFKCGSRYSIGLSATPKRKDGLTCVLEWSLGNIISNEVFSDIDLPIVEFINAEYSTKIVPKFNFRAQLNAPNLINQLVIDPKRNEQIINKIIELNKIGRKILVLSGRREHCINLNKLINVRNSSLKTGIYMGSMKQEDLEKSNLADIIFATYSAVSEAYDNKKLDTLVMATGMGDVTQSIGRILRCKNINRPLVIDVTDKEFFMGQSKKRVTFYKKSNYLIKGVKIKEESVDSIEKFMFIE